MSRSDLTDWEWPIFDPLLPGRGERGPPIKDKRRTVNGILWVLRTGAPWRDMPSRYGNWNSAFVRFTRRSKLGGMPLSRFWRALARPPTHQHAAGVKGVSTEASARPLARRLLDQNPSPHECQRQPARLRSESGEAHEVKGYEALMRLHDADPDRLLGDKGYDSDEILDDLAKRGIEPVIRPDRTGRQ